VADEEMSSGGLTRGSCRRGGGSTTPLRLIRASPPVFSIEALSASIFIAVYIFEPQLCSRG
jgi:hypothetical protein